MIKKKSVMSLKVFSEYDESPIVIWGVPFDGTCSNRPGTRFGPSGIRSQIDGLETYSPYLNKSLEEFRYCDLGDLELPLGNVDKVLDLIFETSKSLLEDNKKLITLGGEHLISYPLVKAYIEKYKKLNIIHLDAHADLRKTYLGEKFSHATVMRLIYSMLTSGTLFQYGIRSGTRDEFEFAKNHTQLTFDSLAGIGSLNEVLGDAPIYLTIDLDILDPSVFPGTGTPEPGGVSFKELVQALKKLEALNIVGADIVELSPHYDHSSVSSVVGAKILREVALLMSR